MADNTVLVNMKVVSDISDVVSNVGAIQKSFSKLKLPDKLGEGLNKNITEFYKEYDKYQKKVAEGLKTQGDYNQVEKSLNRMKSLYETIGKEASKVTKLDLDSLLDLGSGDFKKVADEIAEVVRQINQVKIDPSTITGQMKALRGALKGEKFSKEGGLLDQLIGNVRNGNLLEAKKVFKELQAEAQRIMPKKDANGDFIAKMVGKLNPTNAKAVTNALKEMGVVFDTTDDKINPLNRRLEELQKKLQDTKNKATGKILGDTNDFNEYGKGVESVTESLKRMHQEEFNFNRQAQDIDRQIQSYFGLSQMIRKVGDIARDAFATVKDLDKAMTETAVVTNFDVGDMWDMLPTYTAQANQLGSTIKDVYEAATLYYQQGLNTNQAMGLANETLKMARIAGLDATEATNMMTAALRGFNMEVNQMSAQKINDIYSELAAITASDTKEIGSAMERTASIANAANMEFATTSAFLAQMIETTREAPENLGTAMKTIVARFQEMKQDPTKLVDSEGVAMDVNKVDKALKTIGVSLTNTKGEFRDLDDVFLDISAKWDSLSQGQQRYIATIAAGSRQQSRFIAMMSNYERTMELVDAANNSAGASQRQFEKTLDSMEAKLNKLKNAWDQFTMGLMNNQIIKFGVDRLTDGFTIINKFIDILGKLPPKPFEGITKSVLTLVTTLGMLQFGKKASRGLVMGGAAWWKGEEGGFGKNFMSGFSGQAAKAGTADGQAYVQNFNNALKKGQLKKVFNLTKDKSEEIYASQHKTGEYANTFGAAFSQFSAEELSTSWTPQIEAEIRSAFQRATANVDLTQYGVKDADEYLNGMISELKSGKSSAGTEAKILREMTDGKVDLDSTGVNEMSSNMNELNNSFMKAGASLQSFGMALQDTPLAPFGALLSKIGMLLSGFGGTISWVSKTWIAGITVAEGTTLTGVAAMKAGFSALFSEIWAFLTTNPVGWILLAVAGIVAAVKGIDALWESQAEKLEKASNAAAAASEAYDSAKQETSELADAISKIQETDSAFDGLVAGTAEFNEQLVTANEQIMALIDKYPMLNDSRYLSTDKNGRMRINQAGLDAVQKYQKQIQANASAMNLIQTADLNAVENQQKADELRKAKGDMTIDELEKNRKQADLLEQRVKAETDLARQNAIRVSLADKEIHNAETMSKIMADQYETKKESVKLDVEAMSKHERRQAYADYHGYTYDKATKKIKDVEGNEIDYDDEAIKDEVIEQQVILKFQEDAESLEKTLSSVNSKFASGLEEQTAGSAHVISDILSNNVETDEEMLRKVLSEPNRLQGLVDSLSEAEMAAILGISASSITDKTIDQYKTEIVNKLTGNAKKIAEAQAESYTDLATMMAKAQGNILDKNGNIIGQKGQTTKQIEQAILQQINNLKPEYAHLMSSIGSQLQEFAGEDTMAAFVNTAYDIYSTQGEQAGQTINELNKLIDGTHFDSAISRLNFYNKAIQSDNKSIQSLGKTMKETVGEANLLGQAFDEFLGSSDWNELTENADDFKNALGEYDAAGIQKAAEQSRTLNELLKTGAISAGGVAAALQGMDDGTITNLNSTVLTLLSSFNRLADAASEAHKIVEGFDPGIDTGEGEDFVQENAEKIKEYYDNGEYGNEQLQNYIKLAAGTEKWNRTLQKNGGNLREAEKQLMHYATAFKDGFGPVWENLTQGKNFDGSQLELSKDLEEQYKDLKFFWDDNNDLNVELGDLGTEELEQYFIKALGLSEDYAKLLMQDLANYDATLSAELRANDIKKSLSDRDFQEAHRDSRGSFILSDSDIRAVGASLDLEGDINTKDGLEEATQAIEKLAGVELEVFRTQNDDGSEREDYGQLLADYAKSFYSTETKDLFGIQELQQGGRFDIGKLISDGLAKGAFASQNQASQAAYEAIQQAKSEGIQDLLYNGQLLDLSEITSYKDYLAATEKLTDSAQWYEVGQSIAEGIINYIQGKDNSSKSKDNVSTDTNTDDNSNKYKVRKGTTIPGVGYVEVGESAPKEKDGRNFLQRLDDWFVKQQQNQIDNMNKANTPAEVDKEAQYAIDTKIFDLLKYFFTPGTENPDPKTNGTLTPEADSELSTAGTVLTEAGISLNNSDTQLSLAATQLSTAATALNSAANKLNNTSNNNNNGTKSSLVTSATSTGAGVINGIVKGAVQNNSSNFTVNTGDSESKLQAVKKSGDEAYQATNRTSEFTINTPGAEKLAAAAKDANTLSKSTTTKTVEVKAGKADTSNVKSAQGDINNTKAKIQVGASIQPAIDAARSAQRIINGMTARLNVSINQTGNRAVSIIVKKGGTTVGTATENLARGQNNYGVVASPLFGSAARGHYGQVGPKGKGGLTLTGEEGYEIAWLPSENRSMILGANGPQMLSLPGDAVVWTHEQSKKIVKQRAIPAGSHAEPAETGRKRQFSGGTGSSGSGKKNKDKNKKSKDSTEKSTKKLLEKVNVWWDNFARRNEARQRMVDKASKAFEKSLKGMTGTSSNAAAVLKDYQTKLVGLMNENTVGLNQATQQLHNLDVGGNADSQAIISYSTTTTKKTKKGKKKTTTTSKQEYADLGAYIDYNVALGTYEINQAALDTISNLEQRKAIADAANQRLNDLLSKRNNAEDAIQKAQEELEKAANTMYETFYSWEKSINEIYLLSKRLEELSAFKDFSSSLVDLESAMLRTGYRTSEQGRDNILDALTKGQDTLAKQIETAGFMAQARETEFQKALSLSTYYERYKKQPDSTEAQNDYNAAKQALELYKQFDSFEAAVEAIKGFNDSEVNKEYYDKVQKVLDDIYQKEQDTIDASQEVVKLNQEIYSQIEEYNDFIIDFQNEMLEGIKQQAEDEIKKLDQLNDSLTKSLKQLLDEVKQKLDERRRQEDNAKTENDISQKQQRLAMLRADTSGGHQVEIAQLEKEIAEAQQSYQRTLEDQLLDRLQQQADNAEQQRQHQIELLEAANELAVATGITMKQIEEWLRTGNKEALKEAYRRANHYYDEDISAEKRRSIDDLFEEEYAKYGAYIQALPQLDRMTKETESSVGQAKQIVEDIPKTEVNTEIEQENKTDAAVENLPVTPKTNNRRDEMEYNFTLGDFLSNASLSGMADRVLTHTGREISYSGLYNKALEQGQKLGYDTNQVLTDISKRIGWKKLLPIASRISGIDMNRLIITFQSSKDFQDAYNLYAKDGEFGMYYPKEMLWSFDKTTGKRTQLTPFEYELDKLLKRGIKPYKTGGLANYTGPAWLDGTPSKPELVLNAKDTQNFIALKDVLSHALGSTSQTNTSYGNAVYEININVDHINNDYDVDKITKRVKENIIKDSSYRNVTQVRKFR